MVSQCRTICINTVRGPVIQTFVCQIIFQAVRMREEHNMTTCISVTHLEVVEITPQSWHDKNEDI